MNPGEPQAEVEPLLDLRQAGELGGYFASSLRRHRWLILLTALVTTALTIPALIYLPRSYTTTARVTARREVIMPALAHPRRSLPFYADNPAHHAPEMTLREDHLRELIRRIDLKNTFRTRRPPLLQLKDAVMDWVAGPQTESEYERSLMGTIEKNVRVSSDNEIVTITGSWRDPVTAAELVETLQVMFIEERRHMEVEPIKDAVTLLEDEVRKTGKAVDLAFAELRVLHQADKTESQRKARRLRNEVDSARLAVLKQEQSAREAQRLEFEQFANLQSQLIAKRRSIAEMEAAKSRQAMELRAQLASLETRLGEKHPDRQAVQRNLQAVESSMPELTVLKKEEQELTKEFGKMGGKETVEMALASAAMPIVVPVTDPAASASSLLGRASDDEDEAVVHKRTQLRMLVDQSQDLQERLLGARIEQRVAEDALRFRYYVLREAEAPRKPDKPQPYVVVVAGLGSGFILGIFLALARDILSGRVFHPWQVERFLGLRLMGHVDLH